VRRMWHECSLCCGRQVAGALAELPLPPLLQRLERLFGPLNAVCAFLLTQHIQARPAATGTAFSQLKVN